MLTVIKIRDHEDMETAFSIRESVFVKEQGVDREDEYDAFEEDSNHFLAFYEAFPCGTARWRLTEKGIKLERFAVLQAYRNKKVGAHLLQAVLSDIKASKFSGKKMYLHAQAGVLPFYEKAGFKKVGEMFEECGIQHFKMVKLLD